jgi:hypothetical protein
VEVAVGGRAGRGMGHVVVADVFRRHLHVLLCFEMPLLTKLSLEIFPAEVGRIVHLLVVNVGVVSVLVDHSPLLLLSHLLLRIFSAPLNH